MAWLVTYGDNVDTAHVIPYDDEKMHDETRECSCNPKVEVIDENTTVVIHNSFDGREGFEMAKKIIFEK